MVDPMPGIMRALITQANWTASVETTAIPAIDDDEVLVRVEAVELTPQTGNVPVEKLITNISTICGCDLAGDVVRVGANVTSIRVGDRVAAFVHGGMYTSRGAFAEYAKATAELTWKIPEGTSYEEAASLSGACWTAVQGLFHPKRLGLVEPPGKVETEQWIFVYGGSSSVGLYIIQFAHLIGLKVATVASPRNFDLLKSLGADVVFDNSTGTVMLSPRSKKQQITLYTIHLGFDNIATAETQEFSVKTFSPATGKLLVLRRPQESAKALRSDIIFIDTSLYTVLGRAFPFMDLSIPAAPEDRAHMAAFLHKIPGLVASGAIKPNPLKVWPGGLSSITDGMQYTKEGKNSGEKIVFRIREA